MITSKDLRWYKLAEQIASESLCHSRHGCVIVSGGSVISLAANRFSISHPMCKRYLKQSLHAEQRALLKAKTGAEGATLYSARLHRNPVSMPCAMCWALMIDAGIRKVIYNNGAEIVKERI